MVDSSGFEKVALDVAGRMDAMRRFGRRVVRVKFEMKVVVSVGWGKTLDAVMVWRLWPAWVQVEKEAKEWDLQCVQAWR